MRTYASYSNITALAQLLYEKGLRVGQAKAYLLKSSYIIKGLNVKYELLDQALDVVEVYETAKPKPKAKAKPRKPKAKPEPKPKAKAQVEEEEDDDQIPW